MKKSLLALAALASVAGAASAQSSVTLYGVADAWGGRTQTKYTGGVKVDRKVWGLFSGGLNGSRWGLKGSEELGGGLKALFTLEQGFNIDDASNASGANTFSRQAYVGLGGGFGEFRLGRQYTAYDELRGATNAAFDTTFTTTGTVFGYSDGDYISRANNQVYYTTPSLGGFGASVGAAAGEAVAPRILSAKVQYAAGPLLVGLAHQQEGRFQAAAVAPAVGAVTNKKTYTLLAGAYDLGVVKFSGGYERESIKAIDSKQNAFQAGVTAPIGAASVGLGFAVSKVKVNGATVSKGRGFNVFGMYDFSKRTAAYAGLSTARQKNNAGDKLEDATKYGVGIRHKF